MINVRQGIFTYFVLNYSCALFLVVKDIHVDVVAILNDTTGTLMAGSYLDKKCGIGLIMGKGSLTPTLPHFIHSTKKPLKSSRLQIVRF